MAKIFITYKHNDTGVYSPRGDIMTAREYVNFLVTELTAYEHISKSEHDGEDLRRFKDETIESKLRDQIYDSSITIVLISKNMKEAGSEDEQWIPWEISYSLKEVSRDGRISHTNAILAVVIPDENGSYEYFVKEYPCGCNIWSHSSMFNIIGKNMFNRKQPKRSFCANHGQVHIKEDHSYIYPVKWGEFVGNIDKYINIALAANENLDDYNIEKRIIV
jgi:MTH538 TIR-like domain (DUF1863)